MKHKRLLKHFKNMVVISLALAIVICFPGKIVNAAGVTDVTVMPLSENVDKGEQFQVSIYIVPNNDIAGVQFDLSFDPSLVNVDSIEEGSLLSQDGANAYFIPGVIDNDAGTITEVYGAITSPGQTVSTSGTFATITFTAGTAGGTCPLSLSNVVVGDIGGNPVSVNVINDSVDINHSPVLDTIGSKTVNEGATLTFTVSATDPDGDSLTYSASNLPTGASFNPVTRTFSWTPDYDQSGVYSGVHFEVTDGSQTDSENITVTVNNNYYPDLNDDGDVNVLDMIIIGQHWGEEGSYGWITEDINEDGIINVLDVILIGQNWTG